MPCWNDLIAPDLKAGKDVLISAHGNSLRALVKMLDEVSLTSGRWWTADLSTPEQQRSMIGFHYSGEHGVYITPRDNDAV